MSGAWTADEVALFQTVVALKPGQMRKPVPIPASPRGTLANGLVDYRGFPLTQLARVAVDAADFTGARAPKNQFGVDQSIEMQDVTAERSIFDRAGRFHRLAGSFNACSFQKITTKICTVSGTFADCDFSDGNFKGAHFNARFIRCRFHGCNLHVASWPSSFQDCEFNGASIHDLFADVRAIALSSNRVTFTVTMSKVISGEA